MSRFPLLVLFLVMLLISCGPPMSSPDAGVDASVDAVDADLSGLGTNEVPAVLEVPVDAP